MPIQEDALTKYKQVLADERAHIAKREIDVQNQMNYVAQEKARLDRVRVDQDKREEALGVKGALLHDEQLRYEAWSKKLKEREAAVVKQEYAAKGFEGDLMDKQKEIETSIIYNEALRTELNAKQIQLNADIATLQELQRQIAVDKALIDEEKAKNKTAYENNVYDAETNRKRKAELDELEEKLKARK